MSLSSDDHSRVRKLISEVSFIGAGHAISVAATLGLQIFVVRATEPSIYGAYVSALAVATLIEAIFVARSGELALQTVGKSWVLGRFASARASAKRLVRLDLRLNSALYLVTVMTGLALSWLFGFNAGYIAALGLMVPLQTGYGVYKCLFISTGKVNQQAMFEAGVASLTALLGVGAVLLFGIAGLIAVQVVVTLVRNLIARHITYRWWPAQTTANLADSAPDGTWHSWRTLGFHSIMRNAFVNGSGQADILILSAAQAPAAVAIYKVAKSLASIPTRLFNPLWFALRPRMLRAIHDGDGARILRLVGLPAAAMIALLLLVLLPMIVFADDAIGAIYGARYRSAALPFIWLLAGAWVFRGATAWFNIWVIISEEMVAGTAIYGILFGMLIVFALTFGHRSPLDMAVAVSLSMGLTSVLAWMGFVRTYRQGRAPGVPEALAHDV